MAVRWLAGLEGRPREKNGDMCWFPCQCRKKKWTWTTTSIRFLSILSSTCSAWIQNYAKRFFLSSRKASKLNGRCSGRSIQSDSETPLSFLQQCLWNCKTSSWIVQFLNIKTPNHTLNVGTWCLNCLLYTKKGKGTAMFQQFTKKMEETLDYGLELRKADKK